jgi:Family of unknown function (DUF6510)
MSDDALWLDGNGVAGLLAETFRTEMTTAQRQCGTCGVRNPVGAFRAYRGAGTVLRCPVCDDVAMRIAVLPDQHIVQLTGAWLVRM